ncbi:hypothetical protein GMDG_01320 [Pseudogymnoascus destructans 20631-21]|uniref:Major facilitator superfamily (MFS) profile domain-containing protein n=1 Tax=Pseudogymnoascus destructans (strain ATCC MYA-4855 / 20631-21) TaxID=658429 RepID=L8FVL5_PSED2|nr:hypothetical protein GMDG_01320 [Pseudogymnoascus destructans 20631-21]
MRSRDVSNYPSPKKTYCSKFKMNSNGSNSEKTVDFCEVEDGTLDDGKQDLFTAEHIDDDPVLSKEEQRKIIHRVDGRLVATTVAMYAISLMDRTNLGNAGIAGMNGELDMEDVSLCLFHD